MDTQNFKNSMLCFKMNYMVDKCLIDLILKFRIGKLKRCNPAIIIEIIKLTLKKNSKDDFKVYQKILSKKCINLCYG